MASRAPALTGVLASAGILLAAVAPAQAVTTWNWSFTTTNPQRFGSGTFTTADVNPTTNTPYQITGISGTYTSNSIAYSITSLGIDLPNTFYYDGTSTSPIIIDGIVEGGGINFIAGASINIIRAADRGPVVSIQTPTEDFSIASSLLQPVSAPAPASVPGPLPLLGAAAAFGASRRLRQRIKLHKSSQLG